MIDRQPPEFIIRPDEEPPDSIFTKKPAKRWGRTAEKTGRFGSLLPLFLIVPMGVALVYFYLDIRGQLLQLNTSGDQKTQTISENFESKFSFLSLKVAALEDGITRIDKTLSEQSSATAKLTTPLQQAINALQSDSKAARSALDILKTESEKKGAEIATMANEFKTLGASIKPIETEVRNHSAAVNSQIKGALEEVKSLQAQSLTISNEIKPLKSMEAQFQKQVAQLDANLKQQEAKASQELDKAISKFTMQILALKQKIADMEQSQAKPAPRQQPASPPPSEPRAPAAEPAPEPPVTRQPGPPKPGEVIERDIRQ